MTRQAKTVPLSDDSTRPYILTGLAVLIILLGGLAAWATTARIAGAVVAPGTVAVESNRKTVDHLEGGIVGDILVQEGDRVDAGQLLIRLDDTIDRANLVVLVDQLTELQARHARLDSELKGLAEIAFSGDLLVGRSDAKLRDTLEGQRALFAARRAARDGERDLMLQRIGNFQAQITGLDDQAAAKTRQIALIDQELTGVEALHAKGHAPLTRVLALKREASRIAGERAEHLADKASAANQIGEVKLRMIQADHELREAVTAELREVETEIQRLSESRVAATARLARAEIRAPNAGRVLGLQVHTQGGVIRAGAPILDIVPEDDELILQVQVPPADVDRVAVGLVSRIRFTAFDQQTTPEISGRVAQITPDRVVDAQSGLAYYQARIEISDKDMAKLNDVTLVPGMPADVMIQTGDRLAISYLLKPLLDNFARTFKEG